MLTVCAELFHTAAGTAFAGLSIDDPRKTWPIRSRRFRAWLRRRYYEATGSAASAVAIKLATLDQLEARAQFDGPERSVPLHVAETRLAPSTSMSRDDQWRAGEIAPNGRRVIDKPPVHFHRPPGPLRLPIPERGGSLDALRSLLNLPNDFVLVVAWVLAALRADGPYLLLAVYL